MDDPVIGNLYVTMSILINTPPLCLFEREPTHHDGYHRSKYNNVSAEKRGQTLSTSLNFPRTCRPASNENGEDRSSPNVEPTWHKERQVIARCDRVC